MIRTCSAGERECRARPDFQLQVGSLAFSPYLAANRTRQACARNGMHTWRVFCFQTPALRSKTAAPLTASSGQVPNAPRSAVEAVIREPKEAAWLISGAALRSNPTSPDVWTRITDKPVSVGHFHTGKIALIENRLRPNNPVEVKQIGCHGVGIVGGE